MPRLPNGTPVKKLLFCYNIDAETVLLLLSCVILYIASFELYEWWPFHCMATAIPYAIVILCHYLAGFFLLFGVMWGSRSLILAFAWFLVLSLIGSIAFILMFYCYQDCLCHKGNCLRLNSSFSLLIYLKYVYFGLLTGINFVIVLYILLLVVDYLAQIYEEPSEIEMGCSRNR